MNVKEGDSVLRLATREDVRRMLEIYAPYIMKTTITFEYEVPDYETFMARFERISARYPWIVWEEDGRVLGYAYADQAFSRAAYAWDADMSIYLDESARGRGMGSVLYGCLEEMLRRRGYHNLYAIITGENAASIRFHEGRGYERLGTLKSSGYKFGRWLDVYWYGRRLCAERMPGEAPAPFVSDRLDEAILAEASGRP